MSYIISVSLLLIFYLLFRINKYHSKRNEVKYNKKREEILQDIRADWNRIQIKTSDCDIIKFDALIDKNKQIHRFENRSFFEVLNREPYKQEMINEKRSKLICNQKMDGETVRKFVKIILIDNTVLEFKVKIRDFIDVYIPKEENEDYYYIDLEFLNEAIDLNNNS